MKLKEIYIQNFRGIKNLHLKFDTPTTILIGENNTGKTTILEAIRLILNRQRISKRNLFSEYDYHSENLTDEQRQNLIIELQQGLTEEQTQNLTEEQRQNLIEGQIRNRRFNNEILIELWFREDEEEEWDDEITTVELDGIIQRDLNTSLFSLGIRLKSNYDIVEKVSNPVWYWLGLQRNELREINSNHTTFFKIVQYFYLDALRDANFSFSGRSYFWNEFLKLNLTPQQETTFTQQLKTINDTILSADAKVGQLKTTLNDISNIVVNDINNVSIQAFPEKPWDLSDKAKLMITTSNSQLELPLGRFGQGTQSLSVLMLFKAYTEILMRRNTHNHAFSILGLEEPEVHLYPQAIRSLWAFLQEQLTQQKIISTHSTFFIQEADLTSLKLLKRKGNVVKLFYIKQSFEIDLPTHPDLIAFCHDKPEFTFVTFPSTDGSIPIGKLTLKGSSLNETHFNRLKTIYTGNETALQSITNLKKEASIYLSNDDLLDLKYYTERIRGEIFFAKAWLLCEGQSEYLILRYFAQVMGKNLDQLGISVIDYKNNGSAGLFILLAKHFDMPWLLLSDSDQALRNTKNEILRRNIPQTDIDSFVKTYPNPNTDIELFLYENGFKNDYIDILIPDKSMHPNQRYRVVKKIDFKSNAVLYYLDDNSSQIRITLSPNLIFIFNETERGFNQIKGLILSEKDITETELQSRKNAIVFNGISEQQILVAKIADANCQIIYNQDTTYHLNYNILGKRERITNSHIDFEVLLSNIIVTQIRKHKILNSQKLIRKLQREQITNTRVPQFFQEKINEIISLI